MMRRNSKESRSFASCAGKRFYVERHGEVLPDGTIRLIDDKEIDLQEKYNAEFPATTIENILKNSNPLESFADDGTYGIDATKLPTTFAEFLQLQIDRKREFDRLPVEIKQRFDNDLNKYMATAGSESWFTKLGITFEPASVDPQPGDVVKEEVK